MDGFTLGQVAMERPTGALSGGGRARLALVCALLARPDVLLLDEPTNHLDDAAIDLLATILRTWDGPVLFASHDRAFLDAVATSIADLDQTPSPVASATGGVARFTGGYSELRAAKAAQRARWQAQYAAEQGELDRLRERMQRSTHIGHAGAAARTEARAAKKFYADRTATVVSRRVKAARLALDRLAESQLRKPPPVLSFAGFASDEAASTDGTTLLAAKCVAIAGRLAPVSLDIRAGERWLITGDNGSGKSTLMAILAGSLRPEQGTVVRGNRVRVGLLTQDWPDAELSAKISETYRAAVGDGGVDLASLGLLRPQDRERPLGAVSVGVRRRLQLAITIATVPDVLLLDEPTNHLSLDLVEELETALPDYPGAVVIASHDRWLRERWQTDRLTLHSPTLHNYPTICRR